jgi:tryptophanyl-tRNA synthetase
MLMTKGRIFSGMQPSGRFHLGNYMGALENWVRLQHEYECFFSIVDLHALTSSYSDTSKLQENVMEMAIDWLSAGLDPEKNVIFVQSHVKEHAELALLLGMSTPLSWLERVPTYKDKLQNWSAQGKDNNTYGFLGYPVLMAADIMLYKATCVPVGEDQSAHLELTREIVRRFNYLYNREVFPEPQAVFSKAKVLPGIDGRKMSKSYGNTIPFGAGPEEMWERIRMMTTDPQRIKKTDPGHPEVCIVYAFHKVFNPEEYEEIGVRCRAGEIGCVECKKRLAEKMNALLADIHTKREELSKKPEYIKEVLDYGAQRARKEAEKTMAEVKTAMNVL